MIVIAQTEVTPWVTEWKVSALTRGAEQIETLAGTIYTYGTGTGEELSLSLGQVPSMIFGYLKDTMIGAGSTFMVSYPSDSIQVQRLCALSGELEASMVTPADGGLWDLSATLVTVD